MTDSMWDHLDIGTDGLSASAAQSKRPQGYESAPTQQPMRAGQKPATQKAPTSDQKRHRRQMAKNASDERAPSAPEGWDGAAPEPCDHFEDDGHRSCTNCWWAYGSHSAKAGGPTGVGAMSSIASEETVGSKSTCNNCGRPITLVTDSWGAVWTHDDFDTSMCPVSDEEAVPTHTGSTHPRTAHQSTRTATKESTMTQPTEADLLTRLAAATTLAEQATLSAQIEEVRAHRREAAVSSGEFNWDALGPVEVSPLVAHAQAVALAPMTASVRLGHTDATDWMNDLSPATHDDAVLSANARAAAVNWYASVWAPLKQDPTEFSRAAYSAGVRQGAAFGLQSTAAVSVFMDQVKHLHKKAGFTTTALQETVDTYVSDGKTTVPVAPAKTDDTFDEWGIGSDLNDTPDPKTNASEAPSLTEGDAPETGSGEGVENPNYGQSGQDKSTFTPGNTDDLMNTQSARRTAGAYAGGSPKSGDTAKCHKDGKSIEFFDGQWMHLNSDPVGKDGSHNDVYPNTPKEQADADAKKSGSRRTAISVTNVGIEGDHGTGTANGKQIKFRLSEKDLADLKAVLYGDLAVNFSGVDIEQSDIIEDSAQTEARLAAHMGSMFGRDGGMGIATYAGEIPESFKKNWDKDSEGSEDGEKKDDDSGKPWLNEDGSKKDSARHTASEWSDAHPGETRCEKTEQTKAGDSGDTQRYVRCTLVKGHGPDHDFSGSKNVPAPTASLGVNAMFQMLAEDPKSTGNTGEGGIQEGDSPESGHSEGYTQETPTGDLDKSNGGNDPDSIGTGGTGNAATSQEGAYTASLAQIGGLFRGQPVSANTATFAASLERVASIDDEVGGVSARQIVSLLLAAPEVPGGVKRALSAHLAPRTATPGSRHPFSREAAARPLYEIAADIKANWPNVYFGAVPYLDALGDLSSMSDKYGEDDASTIVAYLLSNMRYWKGPEAARLKGELRALPTRTGSKTAADHIECVACATYGSFYCRESVGVCDLCDKRYDVFMDYTESGDRETPNETVCLDCLCNGAHLKAAHTPEGEALVKSLGITGSVRTAEVYDGGGLRCKTCGDKIARDDGDEDNVGYHHDNGEKHDHEATPDESWEDSGKAASRKTATWENPTPNCLKIMQLQSDAYDALGINGFSGGSDDPKRIECIAWIKAKIHDLGLNISTEDIDSLEDNNSHAGAEAAIQYMSGHHGARRTATRYCTTCKVYVGEGNRDTHTKDSCHVETRKAADALRHFAAERCPGSGQPMKNKGARNTEDSKFFGYSLGDCPSCGKKVRSKTNVTPNHQAATTASRTAGEHAAPTDHEATPEWDTATAYDLCDTCGWPVAKGKDGSWSHEAKNPTQWTDKRESSLRALAEGASHPDQWAIDNGVSEYGNGGPTNSWKCEVCGATVERWRGESDVSCPKCDAQYNAGGQRLRDDWRSNMSNYDDEIGDMEGYENSFHDARLKSFAAAVQSGLGNVVAASFRVKKFEGGSGNKWGVWNEDEDTWHDGDHDDAFYAAGIPYWEAEDKATAAVERLSKSGSRVATSGHPEDPICPQCGAKDWKSVTETSATCNSCGYVGKGQQTKGSRKTAMPDPAAMGVSIGDIFYSSWGYDQTNVDFYEVVGLTGASVRVREVAQRNVGDADGPHESVVPVKGQYIDTVMTKRINDHGGGPGISLNSYSGAWLWDGKPKYKTGYGYGH